MPKLHFNEEASPHITHLEDGTDVIRTCASGIGCHNIGCGIKVYVKDGKLEKIAGDPEHPISKGRLCVRCLTAKDYIYHEDRILYPMKRDRQFRGDPDKFERISWDEALDLIIDNYWKTVEKYGVNSTSVWCGTGREPSRLHFQFANDVFGTLSTVHANSGWSCYLPRLTIMSWVLGTPYVEYDNSIGFPDRYDDPKWVCPKYMLIWGRDQLRSNADGLWGHSTIEMMKRGMKLVVVDPRVNWLATRAEVYLQLRPGTDAALALGLLNVIINEDLYDHEFVEEWCYGFDELKERVQDYPVEKVAEITTCDPDDIRHAARCISQKPSTLSMGLPVDQNPNSFQIGQAVLSIFAICGDIDVPGGCFVGRPSTMKASDSTSSRTDDVDTADEGLAKFGNVGKEPLGHDRYPAYNAFTNNTHPDFTLDVLESKTGLPYPLKFAYVYAHNPLACMPPQPKRWMEGLRTMDFVAVADIVMTPTIVACADVVLPVCSMLEHDGLTTNNFSSMAGQVGAITQCIEPLGESKSDCEILTLLYQRLYPEGKHNWKTVEGYYNDELAQISGVEVTYSELKEKVIGQLEIEYYKYRDGLLRPDGQPGFNTMTGKIELYSLMLEGLGDDPLPYYIEPYFSANARPDLAEEYPLTLTTGARRFTSFHSENRHIEKLREIHPWPTVDINPKVAKENGILEGNWVYIENQFGRIKQVAHITPTVKEDVVSADHGWWYPERDPKKLYDTFESNVCSLIPHEMNGPLGVGTLYKSMPCKVYPVPQDEIPTESYVRSADAK